MKRRFRVAGALCLVSFLMACGSRQDENKKSILLIGIDGFEWDVMLPMLRRGRMPEIAKLMSRGTYGLLPTTTPTLSPVIWTTIATGKPREQHGILEFVHRSEDGTIRLYDSTDRRTKAIWNIASDYGRRVALVGWWMTFPVEKINGVMVAQTNTIDTIDVRQGKNVWKGRLVEDIPGQVYPPHRTAEMMSALVETQAELPRLVEDVFGSFPHALSQLGENLWNNCMWSFRADGTYVRIAEDLLASDQHYDLAAVYLGGPDVVGHRFWRYYQPGQFRHRPTAAQIENFGGVLESYYEYIDASVGRLVSKADENTRILVISDHGMQPVNQDSLFNPNDPPNNVNSAHHLSAPPGVLIAAGPDIRPGKQRPLAELRREHLPSLSSVTDIAPTLLALLGIPSGADMQGKVSAELLDPAFLEAFPPTQVPTHDSEAWRRAQADRNAVDPGSAERIRQLQALGYVGTEAEGD